MKDNWIKAFQEKLGDYELELPAAAPQPAAVPRRDGWIALAVSGAAAAAAAALLLLPTHGDRGNGRLANGGLSPETALVEPVTITPDSDNAVEGAGKDAGQLLADATSTTARPASAMARRKTVPTEAAKDVAADEPAAPEETTADPGPTNDNPAAQAPTTVSDQTADATAWAEGIDGEQDHPRQKRAGLAARLHLSPQGLQTGFLGQNGDLAPVQFDPGTGFYDPPVEAVNLIMEWYANKMDNRKEADLLGRADVRCALPVRSGLALQLPLSDRFALESGIDYALHRASVSFDNNVGVIPDARRYGLTYRMHYIGIPLKGIWTLAQWEKAGLYAAAGGEAEWMVSGRIQAKVNGRPAESRRIEEHPLLFSLAASAGAEYNFTPRLGLYAEPGLAWHFKPQGNLPNYYRDHPLSFDLHLGLRFNFF